MCIIQTHKKVINIGVYLNSKEKVSVRSKDMANILKQLFS